MVHQEAYVLDHFGVGPFFQVNCRTNSQEKLKKSNLINFSEFVERCDGYTSEEHLVMTDDGFIITLHRLRKESYTSLIPNEEQRSQKIPAILLMHGCMMSSDVWLARYDVWVGNFRGNKYSSKHIRLKPSDVEYWDFSLDELALYDIPAMVDYVLNSTSLSSISYMGFSQGTAAMFAALSLSKTLQSKIDVFIALAATTVPKGVSSKVVSSFIKTASNLMFPLFGRTSFLESTLFWKELLYPSLYVYLLDFFMQMIFNWKLDNIAFSSKLQLYQCLFSTTSTKLVVHWFQIMESGRFQMFDDTRRRECIVPKFTLSNIKTKMLVFSGNADTLSNIEVCFKGTVQGAKYINVEHYEHLDFLWASDLDSAVLPILTKLIKKNKF